MGTVQLIAILAALIFTIQVLYLTSKNKLHDQQAFMWIVFAVGGLAAALFLPGLNKLAQELGVTYMPSLVFMVAFLVVLSLLMYHTIILSKQQEKLKNLAQEFAYLSKEIREMKKEAERKENQHDAH